MFFFSLFADLLVSKGRVNVEKDKDVTDLFNILDTYSASIINSWGGLRNFLAISPTFAFDPDDSNIVYLAEEAEIYLLSKKEAASKAESGFYIGYEADDPEDRNGAQVDVKNSNGSLQSDPVILSFSRSGTSASIYNNKTKPERKQFQRPSATSKIGEGTFRSLKDSKEAISKQRAMWEQTENARGIPDGVFEGPGRFKDPNQKAAAKALISKSMKEAAEKFKIRTEENAAGNVNDEPDKRASDGCPKSSKCEFCGYGKGQKIETAEAIVMTDGDWEMYKELYESEVKEKKYFCDKYNETMDILEQIKNKLKVEKETAASREMELRAKLEVCFKISYKFVHI